MNNDDLFGLGLGKPAAPNVSDMFGLSQQKYNNARAAASQKEAAVTGNVDEYLMTTPDDEILSRFGVAKGYELIGRKVDLAEQLGDLAGKAEYDRNTVRDPGVAAKDTMVSGVAGAASGTVSIGSGANRIGKPGRHIFYKGLDKVADMLGIDRKGFNAEDLDWNESGMAKKAINAAADYARSDAINQQRADYAEDEAAYKADSEAKYKDSPKGWGDYFSKELDQAKHSMSSLVSSPSLLLDKSVETAGGLAPVVGVTAATGGAGGLATVGLQGGDDAAEQVEDIFSKMTPEEWERVPAYKQALADGYSEDQAKQSVIDQASTAAMPVGAAANMLGFELLGKPVIGKMLPEKLANKFLGEAGAKAAIEKLPQTWGQVGTGLAKDVAKISSENALQEGAQTIGSNTAASAYGAPVDIGEGVGSAMGEAAVTSAGLPIASIPRMAGEVRAAKRLSSDKKGKSSKPVDKIIDGDNIGEEVAPKVKKQKAQTPITKEDVVDGKENIESVSANSGTIGPISEEQQIMLDMAKAFGAEDSIGDTAMAKFRASEARAREKFGAEKDKPKEKVAPKKEKTKKEEKAQDVAIEDLSKIGKKIAPAVIPDAEWVGGKPSNDNTPDAEPVGDLKSASGKEQAKVFREHSVDDVKPEVEEAFKAKPEVAGERDTYNAYKASNLRSLKDIVLDLDDNIDAKQNPNKARNTIRELQNLAISKRNRYVAFENSKGFDDKQDYLYYTGDVDWNTAERSNRQAPWANREVSHGKDKFVGDAARDAFESIREYNRVVAQSKFRHLGFKPLKMPGFRKVDPDVRSNYIKGIREVTDDSNGFHPVRYDNRSTISPLHADFRNIASDIADGLMDTSNTKAYSKRIQQVVLDLNEAVASKGNKRTAQEEIPALLRIKDKVLKQYRDAKAKLKPTADVGKKVAPEVPQKEKSKEEVTIVKNEKKDAGIIKDEKGPSAKLEKTGSVRVGSHNGSGAPVHAIEVSSAGDALGKQFSALNARFGKAFTMQVPMKNGSSRSVSVPAGSTIEHAYQTYVKGSKKGALPADLNTDTLKAYDMLWEEWAKHNPDLLRRLGSEAWAKAKKYNAKMVLSDKFARDGDASQAVSLARILTNIANQGKEVKPKEKLEANAGNKAKYLAKDKIKAAKATQFIGEGEPGSSTERYRAEWGDKANTGKYTDKDKVFVSVNGGSFERGSRSFHRIKANVAKVIEAGGILIVDNAEDAARPYNTGERILRKFLVENGAVETEDGVFVTGDRARNVHSNDFYPKYTNDWYNDEIMTSMEKLSRGGKVLEKDLRKHAEQDVLGRYPGIKRFIDNKGVFNGKKEDSVLDFPSAIPFVGKNVQELIRKAPYKVWDDWDNLTQEEMGIQTRKGISRWARNAIKEALAGKKQIDSFVATAERFKDSGKFLSIFQRQDLEKAGAKFDKAVDEAEDFITNNSKVIGDDFHETSEEHILEIQQVIDELLDKAEAAELSGVNVFGRYPTLAKGLKNGFDLIARLGTLKVAVNEGKYEGEIPKTIQAMFSKKFESNEGALVSDDDHDMAYDTAQAAEEALHVADDYLEKNKYSFAPMEDPDMVDPNQLELDLGDKKQKPAEQSLIDKAQQVLGASEDNKLFSEGKSSKNAQTARDVDDKQAKADPHSILDSAFRVVPHDETPSKFGESRSKETGSSEENGTVKDIVSRTVEKIARKPEKQDLSVVDTISSEVATEVSATSDEIFENQPSNESILDNDGEVRPKKEQREYGYSYLYEGTKNKPLVAIGEFFKDAFSFSNKKTKFFDEENGNILTRLINNDKSFKFTPEQQNTANTVICALAKNSSFLDALKSNIPIGLSKFQKGYQKNGNNVFHFGQYNHLAFVDPETQNYFPVVKRAAVLAAIMGLGNHFFTTARKESDVLRKLHISLAESEELRNRDPFGYARLEEAASRGSTRSRIVEGLNRILTDILGVTPNKDVTNAQAVYPFTGLALEIYRSLVDSRFLKVEDIDVSDKTYSVITMNEGKNANVRVDLLGVANKLAAYLTPTNVSYSIGDKLIGGKKYDAYNIVPYTKEQRRALEKFQNIAYRIHPELSSLVKDADPDTLRTLFDLRDGGHLTADLVGRIEKDPRMASIYKEYIGQRRMMLDSMQFYKNLIIEADQHKKENGNDSDILINQPPIYFRGRIGSESRFHTSGYSPGNIKYLRELITPVYSVVDTNNQKHMDNVDLSIGEAYGVKIDKIGKEEALSQARSIIESVSFKDQLVEVAKGEIPKDINIQQLHSLVEYNRIKNAKANNERHIGTSMYLSIDGVANGVANSLNFLGINSTYEAFAKSGRFQFDENGVPPVINGQPVSSYREFLKAGGNDFYTAIASEMPIVPSVLKAAGLKGGFKVLKDLVTIGVLSDPKNVLGDFESFKDQVKAISSTDDVAKEAFSKQFIVARDFVKNPVTQKSYGAGDEALRRSFENKISDAYADYIFENYADEYPGSENSKLNFSHGLVNLFAKVEHGDGIDIIEGFNRAFDDVTSDYSDARNTIVVGSHILNRFTDYLLKTYQKGSDFASRRVGDTSKIAREFLSDYGNMFNLGQQNLGFYSLEKEFGSSFAGSKRDTVASLDGAEKFTYGDTVFGDIRASISPLSVIGLGDARVLTDTLASGRMRNNILPTHDGFQVGLTDFSRVTKVLNDSAAFSWKANPMLGLMEQMLRKIEFVAKNAPDVVNALAIQGINNYGSFKGKNANTKAINKIAEVLRDQIKVLKRNLKTLNQTDTVVDQYVGDYDVQVKFAGFKQGNLAPAASFIPAEVINHERVIPEPIENVVAGVKAMFPKFDADKIKLEASDKAGYKDGVVYYNPESPIAVQEITHELIHAITADKIFKYYKDKEALSAEDANVVKYLENIADNLASRNLEVRAFMGNYSDKATGLSEFVAEAVANKMFNRIKVEDRTMLGKIKSFVGRYFVPKGWVRDFFESKMYDKVGDIVNQQIKAMDFEDASSDGETPALSFPDTRVGSARSKLAGLVNYLTDFSAEPSITQAKDVSDMISNGLLSTEKEEADFNQAYAIFNEARLVGDTKEIASNIDKLLTKADSPIVTKEQLAYLDSLGKNRNGVLLGLALANTEIGNYLEQAGGKDLLSVLDDKLGAIQKHSLEQRQSLDFREGIGSVRSTLAHSAKMGIGAVVDAPVVALDWGNKKINEVLAKVRTTPFKAISHKLFRATLDAMGIEARKETYGSLEELIAGKMPDSIKELKDELKGTTSSTYGINSLLKKKKTSEEGIRSRYNAQIPILLDNLVEGKLEQKDWEVVNEGLHKTGLFSLEPKNFSKFAEDSETASKYVSWFRANNSNELLAAVDDLIEFQRTGVLEHNNVERNVDNILKKFVGNKPKDKQIKDIRLYAAMRAFETLPKDTKKSIRELLSKHSKAFETIQAYHYDVGQNLEGRLPRGFTRGMVNKWDYHTREVPVSKRDERRIVIAKLADKDYMAAKGFSYIGEYKALKGIREEALGYYVGNTGFQQGFAPGALGYTRETYSGANMYSGTSADKRNIGIVITDPTEVAAISRLKQVRNGEGFIAVKDYNGNIVGYEGVINPKLMPSYNMENQYHKVLGNTLGRAFEEDRSTNLGLKAVDELKKEWERAPNADKHNFVDISKSPKYKALFAKLPFAIRRAGEAAFGEGNGFMVRRDLINNALGYKHWSLDEMLTADKSESPYQYMIGNLAKHVFGDKAFKVLRTSDGIVKDLATTAKDFIVNRSVIIPLVNLASNALQLTMRGVKPTIIAKKSLEKRREIATYSSNIKAIMQNKVRIAEAKAKNNRNLADRLEKANSQLNREIADLSIAPLIKHGEFNNLVASMIEDNDFGENFFMDKLEKLVSKIPNSMLRTVADNVLGNRNSAVSIIQKQMNNFGDFIAKSIYYDKLIADGLPDEQAHMKVIDEFINYDTNPGKLRTYLDSHGLTWFMNYKLRSAKVALSLLTGNPLSLLLSGASMYVPGISLGDPFKDNVLTKILNGNISYSLGLGSFFRAPTLLPIASLFH